MHVILLSGKKQSGKDTAANVFIKKHGYTKISFAYLLKESSAVLLHMLFRDFPDYPTKDFKDHPKIITSKLFEDNAFKMSKICNTNITYREFLQKFGTDFIRKYINDSFWVHAAVNQICNIHEQRGRTKFIISDVRFPNEITEFSKDIKAHFPEAIITTIRVERQRTSLLMKIKNKFTEHKSENALDFYTKWDYTVYNLGSLQEYIKNISTLAKYAAGNK